MNAISITNLSKRYGDVEAVTDLSLEVPGGSIFGFLGPNGAGKTTAIKILAGLARPTSGSAEVAGEPVTAQGGHRRHIGYLAQEPRFYDWMTGRQTLRYVAGFYPAASDQLEARIDALLEQAGIHDAGDRKTKTYSGGMRQRLGIAQALIGRPAVLMLDEPASSLDPIGRREVLELMARLRGETTVFFSTHILDDVERVSDHVAILDHGRLVTSANTKELLARFTRGILRVVLGDAGEQTATQLAVLPGVLELQEVAREGDTRTYDVHAVAEQTISVQRAIGSYAVRTGLTLISAAETSLDLEEVFLRLIDPNERAA